MYAYAVAYKSDKKVLMLSEQFENGVRTAYEDTDAHRTDLQERGVKVLDQYDCHACGKRSFDAYMVIAETWEALGMGKRGNLHLRCAQERLGRDLVLTDFTDAPINNVLRVGFDMGKRTL